VSRTTAVVIALAPLVMGATTTTTTTTPPVQLRPDSPSGMTLDIADDGDQGSSSLSPHAGRRGAENASAAYTGPTIVATTLELMEDGTRCARFSSVPGDPGSREGQRAFENAMRLGGADTICPTSPVDPAGNVTPAGAAAHVWHRVTLPDHELWIAPGVAITGLPAYLEINGAPDHAVTFGPDDALGYTVTIEAGSTYDIDWGDGTTLTGVTSQGGPYPNGDLRHSYQVVQTDNTVSVTQRWTARWTATGNGQTVSGVIDADDTLYTSAALPLEIRQIQAVRND
jgi:hypothetical protein